MATIEDGTSVQSGAAMARTARRGGVAVGRRGWRERLRSLGLHVLVGGVGVLFAFPVVWMVLASTRSDAEIFRFPPSIIPQHWALSNYADAVSYVPYALYTYNTTLIAGFNVVGTLISCSLAAYAFSRVQWRGRGVIFVLVLSTMLLPYPVTVIPLYVVFKTLGLLGGFAPLIVPAWFGVGSAGGAFFIFLLRQFFLTIPHELDEAARIDGASHLSIFLRVIIPLSRPALAVVALLTFLNSWTDFFGPLIYLSDSSTYTLSLGLLQFKGLHQFHWSQMMAASVLFILPVVVLFLAAQRTFIQGISMTGLKG
jgi:multiple sugar transport system permease protein